MEISIKISLNVVMAGTNGKAINVTVAVPEYIVESNVIVNKLSLI